MDGEAVFESNGLLGGGPAPVHLDTARLEEQEAGPSGTALKQDERQPVDKGLHSHDKTSTNEQVEQVMEMDAEEVVTPQKGADGFESNGLLGMAPLPGPLLAEPVPTAVQAIAPLAQAESEFFVPLTDQELGIGPSAPATPPARLMRSLDTLPVWKPPMEARTADGRAVQFRRKRKVADHYAGPARPDSVSASYGLLDTPVYKLLEEIKEDRSLLAASKLQAQFDAEAIAPIPLGESSRANADPAAVAARKQMWVDKYRPSKFTDLLGEERCQREVLAWLKEWDRCVYKKIPPGNKKRPREGEENVYKDILGRPRERVLLISGPPGLGKTTLAHVVAAQAGYQVLEVNASDERSAGTVTGRIQNAIDAGSGLAAGGRPTCVIIDEIDGAGGGDQGFVKSLLTLIQDRPARKNGKQPAKYLRRPIICICNDLYAMALRPLRPFSRIIRFKKAQPTIMVKRLREICERESLKADQRSLTTLVEITNADVRSCLNTLQFIKAKAGDIDEKTIRHATVGLKDSGSSLNAVWNNLLVPMSAKKRRQVQGVTDGKYVNRLAFELQACGEYDRIMQGCFEHYPNLKPIDTSLSNVSRVHDWVHFYDRLSHRVASEQEFDLMGYMPFAIVSWHPHMAAPANSAHPVEFPSADYECRMTAQTNKEVATALAQNIPPALYRLYNSSSVLTELAPVLMRIISPNLKPVNANLVKLEERATLSRLVDIMMSLNLRFERDKTEDGQPIFVLEPPIDVFIHYEGKRAADIAVSRFAVRQLVSQAIDAETVKQRGETAGSAAPGKEVHSMFKQSAKAVEPADIADRVPVDFFGRPLKSAEAVETMAGGGVRPPPSKKFRIMYKFNEGSSSAVRKPVKMGSLM